MWTGLAPSRASRGEGLGPRPAARGRRHPWVKAGSAPHSQPRGTQPRHSICPGLFPVRVPCTPWIQAHNPGQSPPLGPELHLRVPRPQVQGDDRARLEGGRSEEGADSGMRVAPHLGAPVPDGAAELGWGGGQCKDLCVTVKLGEAQRAQRGLASAGPQGSQFPVCAGCPRWPRAGACPSLPAHPSSSHVGCPAPENQEQLWGRGAWGSPPL